MRTASEHMTEQGLTPSDYTLCDDIETLGRRGESSERLRAVLASRFGSSDPEYVRSVLATAARMGPIERREYLRATKQAA